MQVETFLVFDNPHHSHFKSLGDAKKYAALFLTSVGVISIASEFCIHDECE